jgi:hypothetical protein
MFKVIKCAVIVSNIGKSAYKKICAVKKRWTDGYRKTAVMDGALVVANIGCTAIMLYDPWILIRPFLMLVPYAIGYIPAIGSLDSVNIIKTVLIYGLEFVQL